MNQYEKKIRLSLFIIISQKKNLLRRKAAEEVKRQQEIRERERQKAISERTGKPKPTHDCNEGINLDI